MTDHPLGAPAGDHDDTFVLAEPSIVDTLLNLDELLSSDVRRAEKTARFCIRPDLEADIDELDGILDSLTDSNGRPLGAEVEQALGAGSATTAAEYAHQLRAKQVEYATAFRSVRMRQMPDVEWKAFKAKWREVIEAGPEYPVDFLDDLIVKSALRPAISPVQVTEMRSKLGEPQMVTLSNAAWAVNEKAGVDIPKSSLSLAVLRLSKPGKS